MRRWITALLIFTLLGGAGFVVYSRLGRKAHPAPGPGRFVATDHAGILMGTASPVTLCAEEYQRMRRRNAILMAACLLTTLAFWHAPSDWPGISWARGISFGAMMVFALADLFKRENFFNTIACPHCGKPAGELIRREGFYCTRCSHCRKEGQTDSRVIWFTGPVSQRWPR